MRMLRPWSMQAALPPLPPPCAPLSPSRSAAQERDAKIRGVRDGINSWVATYRRDQKFSGRPSYS